MDSQINSKSDANFTAKRLERASQHVNKLWLPVNPEVFSRIRTGLSEGRYELGFQFLLDDLKLDVGTLFYSLRELSKLLINDRKDFSLRSPIAFLELAGLERLRKVFAADPRAISKHALVNLTIAQASQLQAMILSATTTEVLAEHRGAQSDLAFLSALLRQLGLALTVWNYPALFERAVSLRTEGISLESALSRTLGFSPLMLGLSVMREWAPSAELVLLVGGDSALTPEEREKIAPNQEALDQMVELCRVGEALARAHDPEMYPLPLEDWQFAKVKIESQLGVDGFKSIESRVRTYTEEYAQAQTPIFKEGIEINPEHKIFRQAQDELLSNNKYVDACALNLRMRLKEYYGWLAGGRVPRDAVAYILKNVLPVSGFLGGCIYTFDAGAFELVPRVKFGQVVLRKLDPLRYDMNGGSGDAVLGAFESPAPFLSRTSSKDTSFVVGVLGEAQKYGVLYFELSSFLLDQSDHDYLINFKAIRQALHDALGIK